jgi:2'-hydroxyisoflavone reductase
MRLLMLGGTQFIGRYTVESALAAGHHVTLFHRGRTGAGLFPGVTRLLGDRSGDGLAALAHGSWDAVFDFSGFLPGQVGASARLLADRVGQYVFMSSIAVYPHTAESGRPETSVTLPPGPDADSFTGETYGPLKVACERVAEAAFPGRTTVIRAGLVVGPGDRFEAFTTWAIAMAGSGEVRCAARPGQPLQFTDVRDLAPFMVRAGTVPLPGVFNVLAPPTTFAEMLAACREAGGGSATVRWTDDSLTGGIVQPRDGSDDGVFLLSGEKAAAAGYRPRPFAETARDVIDWIRRDRPTFTTPH